MPAGRRHRIPAIIPAAGSSSRMAGPDKLLELVGGISILRRTVLEAIHSDANPVLVAIGGNHQWRRRQLSGLDCTIIEIGRPDFGMAESLRSSIAGLPAECDGAMILLPDMPGIRCSHINLLLARFLPDHIVRAADDSGMAGHPVIIPSCLFPRMALLSGDQGARNLIRDCGLDSLHVGLPGKVSRLDLDTKSDWAAWRRGGAGGGN